MSRRDDARRRVRLGEATLADYQLAGAGWLNSHELILNSLEAKETERRTQAKAAARESRPGARHPLRALFEQEAVRIAAEHRDWSSNRVGEAALQEVRDKHPTARPPSRTSWQAWMTSLIRDGRVQLQRET